MIKYTKIDGVKIRIPKNRPPTHPGKILLKEFLKPMKLTQVAFSKSTGISIYRLSRFVNSKIRITNDMASAFSRILKTTPNFWMNLQLGYDFWHSQKKFRNL